MNWDEESLAAKNAALARNRVRADLRKALYQREPRKATVASNPSSRPTFCSSRRS